MKGQKVNIMKPITGEPLNVLHTIGMQQLYPLIRMKLIFSERVDLKRLKKAIILVAQVIPELKSTYNLADNSWSVDDDLLNDMLVEVDEKTNTDEIKWDLFNEPQLKIYAKHLANEDEIYIYLSHILSDGGGFKQLIYLLADCYNREDAAIDGITNNQNIEEIMQAIGKVPVEIPKRTDHPNEKYFFPTLTDDDQVVSYEVHNLKIPTEFFVKMHRKTKQLDATVNELFLTAYLRTLVEYCDQSEISLACPTNLRQFIKKQDPDVLRVANFTARYNLTVAISKRESFTRSLTKVHQEMELLKQSKQFLASINELLKQSQQQTPKELREIAEKDYHIRPISYTNLGIVDDKRLKFNNLTIKDCIYSGAFRRYPNYQVAFSSFKGAAQLVFNMIGTKQEQLVGEQLLYSIAADMFNFAYSLKED